MTDPEAEIYRVRLQVWYDNMLALYGKLPEEVKQALHEWEQKFVDGSGEYATSDWPGWETYIGRKPEPPITK